MSETKWGYVVDPRQKSTIGEPGLCGTFRPPSDFVLPGVVSSGTYAPTIPYERWPAMIRDQNESESSLYHVWQRSRIGVLNQGQSSYCWAFSSVAGLMMQREVEARPFRRLSPSSVAAPIVGYSDRGYYIESALEGMRTQGVASEDFVPMLTTRASDFKGGWREDAARNRVSIAKSIPRSHQIQGSQLLAGYPLVAALDWWGHAVLFLAVLDRYPSRPASDYTRYAILFLNSWGTTWGQGGLGVLEYSQQIADRSYSLEQSE